MIRATAPIGWATRFSTGLRRISGDRVGNFGDERQSLGQRELPRADVFIQPPPAHQFHREVRLRAQRRLDDPRLVDLGDPGMLQPSEELVFVLEPPEHLRIDEARANDFQRDAPPRSILFRFIDDAHRPFRQWAPPAGTAQPRGRRPCQDSRERSGLWSPRLWDAGPDRRYPYYLAV